MALTRDNSPSGSVLAVNNSIRLVKLPPNTRTPIEYTLTITGTPAIGDDELSLTITPTPTVAQPLILDEGTPLSFGLIEVFWRNSDPTSAVQVISTGTATVGVVPLTTVPTVTTATTFGLCELLGVQNLDINRSSNLISIRSQKSGLGNEQRATQISFEISVSGWVHSRDYAQNQIIKPVFNTAGELYAEVSLRDGTVFKGVFGVSNLTTPVQLDQVMQLNYTLFCQGLPEEEVVELT